MLFNTLYRWWFPEPKPWYSWWFPDPKSWYSWWFPDPEPTTGETFINLLTLLDLMSVVFVIYMYTQYQTPSDTKNTELISSWDECDKAIKKIRSHCVEKPVLGFDCKWNYEWQVSLLQIATHKGYCVLFRLCCFEEIPHSLIELLRDRTIIKVGVGVMKDAELLGNNGYQAISTLDLRFVAVSAGVKPRKLSLMSEEVMGRRMETDETFSDWEASKLSEEQIEYAANDAIAGIELYMEMIKKMPSNIDFKQFYDTIYDP